MENAKLKTEKHKMQIKKYKIQNANNDLEL